MKVIYTAHFVDDQEMLMDKYPPIHEKTFYHHATISFMPRDGIDSIEVGLGFEMDIIGRVTTEKVDVLLVEDAKSTNDNPHITLSTANGVPPRESNLEILKAIQNGTVKPLDDSVKVTEGYFDGHNDIKEA